MFAKRAAVTLIAALLAASCATQPPATGTVELRVLAINDFHGNLDPPADGIRVVDATGAQVRIPGGGAARLATLVEQRRAQAPHNVLVAAGDLIGASPMLSGLFHDEPTIESMSMMGLAFTAVGNHEFDEGWQELQRMQNGGCHPVDDCDGPAPFTGARFRYLAASTIVTASGATLFPASAVQNFGGVRVGFIGLTLRGTPDLVPPSSSAGLTFLDEITTINAEAARLQRNGVEAIIVLIHEGGARATGLGDCPGISGAIVGIVQGLDSSIDVVVSGHTNGIYICTINGKLLTSASQYGALLTEIDLTLDRASGDVVQADARNHVVTDTLPQHPAQVTHIDAYRTIADAQLRRPVGAISAPLPRAASPSGESPMGLVVADSMLYGAGAVLGVEPDIALMNPGGVRAGLANTGPVTLSDLFSVAPFGNDLVVLEMTGAEIEALLAQQFHADGTVDILQISERSSFAWRAGPSGNALVPGSVIINGAPLDPARTYRVVTNSFLAAARDGFTAFQNGRPRTVAGSDLDALARYFIAHAPLSAPSTGRVQVR